MTQTLQFKSHVLLPSRSFFFNPVVETQNFVQHTNFTTKFIFFRCSFSHSRKTHIQRPIECAKRTKRRYGYQRSTKFMIRTFSFFASKLKILPQPLDLVIEEFNGGNGGGTGFLRGFGGGGFGWWRRRKKIHVGLKLLLVILVSLFLIFGRQLRSDIFGGVLGFGLFGIILIKGFKRNVQNWIFGVCCFGALMGLKLRKEEAMKLIDEFRVCAPMMEILTKSNARGRRR